VKQAEWSVAQTLASGRWRVYVLRNDQRVYLEVIGDEMLRDKKTAVAQDIVRRLNQTRRKTHEHQT